MPRSVEQLRHDAQAIWRAGVRAVQPSELIPNWVSVEGDALRVGDEALALGGIGRIGVFGAGKAGAGMVTALEGALGPGVLAKHAVSGCVNVPADCVVPTKRIRLHAARPAGVNEPTTDGVAGTRAMLDEAASLGKHDLCLCLISGGGSALLPAPIDGLSLEDKVEITRGLSAAGATIEELNAVRRELSVVKGGGLLRACGAGRVVALILSDVLGDPIESIASGPTVPRAPTPALAIEVLQRFGLSKSPSGQRAVALLEESCRRTTETNASDARVTNLVIGNNAAAVDAAGVEAERRGYNHAMLSANRSEGPAEEVARSLVEVTRRMRGGARNDCFISGGEPTVELAPAAERGKGGRNQQLVLAALEAEPDWRGLALLSGGTDGEDGPTDAAGAWVDEGVAAAARSANLSPTDYLRRNDAYRFFEPLGALLKTGPTHTNVCDLRVVLAADRQAD
ncbi:MAG: DUF4147 domain-containing protein [Planctomycetota bacterium]